MLRETEDLVRHLTRHQHDHPAVRDLNQEDDRRRGSAARVATDLGRLVGSWTFLAVQAALVGVWIGLNALAHRWDPYPFGLLSLVLIAEVALAVVVGLMGLNQAAARERLRAQQQFEQDAKLEDELKALMRHLESQDDLLIEILHRLDRNERELRRLLRHAGD